MINKENTIKEIKTNIELHNKLETTKLKLVENHGMYSIFNGLNYFDFTFSNGYLCFNDIMVKIKDVEKLSLDIKGRFKIIAYGKEVEI